VADIPNTKIKGKCLSPGLVEEQSAYWGELAGLYGSLAMLLHIQEFFSVGAPCDLGCNGDSAMQQAFHDCQRFNPETKHFDLIGARRTIMRQLHHRPDMLYVDGHVDKHKPATVWTESKCIIIACDLDAKAFLNRVQVRSITIPP